MPKSLTWTSCEKHRYEIRASLASLKIEILDSVAAFGRAEWDALLTPEDSPFQRYDFLRSLEAAGCLREETGWTHRFVGAYEGGRLVGALPLFLKAHSYGEFIYDWAWANAAHRAGLPYYPKLVAMIPFTPVSGRCFLVHPKADMKTVFSALLEAARGRIHTEPATGLHLLYTSPVESEILAGKGLAERHTSQFQWYNEGYAHFDDFLGRFRSKRRAQIRRERRVVSEAGIRVRRVSGADASDEQIDAMWGFYASTIAQFGHSTRYLNRRFFYEVCARMGDEVCLLLAYQNNSIVAGTFNLVSNQSFFGRYWGCSDPIPFLHFELCCYAPIEMAISEGWSRVEAGAGGQHKWGRGFLPRMIRSHHEIAIPGLKEAVDGFLVHEREEFRQFVDASKNWVMKPG
jgi:predicted N-acyltransferase